MSNHAVITIAIITMVAAVDVSVRADSLRRTVFVSWSAPSECGATAALYPLIEDHLGRPLDERDALAVRVEITAVGPGYRARLRFADGTPERLLEGVSCESVVDAAALITALALKETAPPPEPPPPALLPAAVLALSSEALDNGTRRWGLALRIDSIGGIGVMQGAGVAAGASAQLLLGGWRIGAEGGLWRDDDASFDQVAGAGATIALWTAGVIGCHSLGIDTLAGCAGVESGSMSAVAYGFADAGRGRELWLAALGRLEAAMPLGFGLSVIAAVDLVAPASAPRFVLDDDSEVYRSRPAAVRLRLGVEARIH